MPLTIDEFSPETFCRENFFEDLRNISIAEVKTLIFKTEDILAREPRLVRLSACETRVLGDTHGTIDITLHIARKFAINGNSDEHIVFLGDYVDRGKHQVDNILLLFLLKSCFPNRVTLLRGNHEIPRINRENGFLDCLSRQFGREDGKILWFTCNRLFEKLPLAALHPSGILMLHGGIPEHLSLVDEIDDLPREYNPEDQRVIEMLWNDPKDSFRVRDHGKNIRGGTTKVFGRRAFTEFMERNNLKTLVRAHEEFDQGYKEFFNGRLLSLFSSKRQLRSPFESQVKPKQLIIHRNGSIEVIPIFSK